MGLVVCRRYGTVQGRLERARGGSGDLEEHSEERRFEGEPEYEGSKVAVMKKKVEGSQQGRCFGGECQGCM